jgi:outer membrane receptor for ferrienterochelin and colicins
MSVAVGLSPARHAACVCAALVSTIASTPAWSHAQQTAGGRPVTRRITVVSSFDTTAVSGAQLTVLRTGVHTRTTADGSATLIAHEGDSVRVRALGFHARTLALPDDARLVLEPLPTQLTQVITTAGLRETRAASSPQQVTVLSRDAIRAAAAVSANQLLRTLPGLQEIAGRPSQTSIAIRGLDRSRVLVLIDGEPAAGGMVENRDIGRLSTMAAERIEVVKGPSSVEFGSDALGGVINLVTAAPSARLAADASARVGGLGRREADLEVSRTAGRVGARVNAGWRQTDRVTAIASDNSTLDRVYDVRADARVRISAPVTLRTNLTFSQQRQRWPVGGGANGFIDNKSAQGFVEAQGHAARGLLRARIFGQRFAYQFRQADGLIPIAGTGDSLEQREAVVRGLVAWSRTIAAHALDVGAQVSLRSLTAPTRIAQDSASERVAELFARDTWHVGDWLFAAGARSTSSSLWGNTVSPSVGAALDASPALRFRATLARGFRAPAFKEMRYTFLNAAGGYQIIGNAQLRPETSWSSAAGVTWSPRRNLTLDAEAYRNALTNLIATQNTGTNAAGLLVFENVNVDRARTEGIETALRWAHQRLDLSLGYDYLRARDLRTGATLDGRATHTARATLSRSVPGVPKAHVDATARYTGRAPLGNTTQALLLSLDAQLRVPVTRALELSLTGTNLLDARPAGWTPAFQRQISVGVRARYLARETARGITR